MILYQHRQFGKTMVAGLGVAVAVCLIVSGICVRRADVALALTAVCALCAHLFSLLTIEVSDEHLRWSFGPGLIRKEVPLAEIADAESTRTHFIEGWGIHLTRRGWLYNVSGFQAVAVRLKSGKRFLLGTDEPEELAAVLREQGRFSVAP